MNELTITLTGSKAQMYIDRDNTLQDKLLDLQEQNNKLKARIRSILDDNEFLKNKLETTNHHNPFIDTVKSTVNPFTEKSIELAKDVVHYMDKTTSVQEELNKPKHTKWSDIELNLLKYAADNTNSAGNSFSAISKKLTRTEASIRAKLNRLNIKVVKDKLVKG